MKRIKKEFNEAVGVPEGIVDAGKQLYDDIKKNLSGEINKNQTEYELNFKPEKPYKIGDMEIDDVELKLELHPIPNDEYGDSNMTVFGGQKLKDTGKSVIYMSIPSNGNIKLTIDKPVPLDWTVQGVLDSFEKNKVMGVSSVSHELKHQYDTFKKPIHSPSHIADYRSKTKLMNFPINGLQRMFFDLYYMDKVENLVRPSELYAKLMTKGIKKSNFLDYFKKEYANILDAMKFNVEDLIDELYENIDDVEQFLNHVDDMDEPVSEMTDEDKINMLLRVAYISYGNLSNTMLQNFLIDRPIEMLIGLSGNKEKYFNKHIYNTTKYSENPLEFYKNVESYLKNTGKKVIKKMAKVYSLLPD